MVLVLVLETAKSEMRLYKVSCLTFRGKQNFEEPFTFHTLVADLFLYYEAICQVSFVDLLELLKERRSWAYQRAPHQNVWVLV